MAYQPIPPVRFSEHGNTGTIDVSKFSRTGSTYTNPDLFKLMQAQSFSTSFDLLLGTEEKAQESIFGGVNIFGGGASSFINGLSSTMPSDVASQTLLPSAISPQIQLVALSYLPGKTATAYNPVTRETINGRVNNVSVENGILLIDIAGTKVPPEYLTQVGE